MKLILDRAREVVIWTRQYMPPHIDLNKDLAAIGVADERGLLAAAIFTDYHQLPLGADIHMSFAATSPRWAQRGVIRGILSYPFTQLKCNRLTALTARSNKRARKLMEGLGFQLEGVHWRAYDGKTDAISYCLRRYVAEEKWLGAVALNRPRILEPDPVPGVLS